MSRSTLPRPASTTLVLRDHAAGLEVLMLKRSLAASFMPGSYVFPGGAVDAADGSDEAAARCTESHADSASRLQFEEPMASAALPHLVAALRECFEECGLWLGLDRPIEARRLAEARRRLLQKEVDFFQLSTELGVVLDTRVLAPWSRWVTPIDGAKRFDAVFFVASAPPDSFPVVDDRETVELVWVHPARALADSAAGSLPLEFATRRTLESLLPFAGVDGVMEAARRPRCIASVHPRVGRTASGVRRVLVPQDAGYDDVMRLDPEGTGTARVPDADADAMPG